MTTIVTMTTESLATVKTHLSRYVEQAVTTHDHVVITRNGEPAAVLMSFEEWERLLDTLQVLSEPDTMAQLKANEDEPAEVLTREQVLKDLAGQAQ